MQKITPFLWFDHQAEDAINFYTSIFKNSKIGRVARYGESGPGVKGTVMTVTFQLEGEDFMALNGGPVFTFSPAISFFVNCETEEEINRLYKVLSEKGTVLMGLDNYGFSEKFGWINDQYGVSWQLNLAVDQDKNYSQKIIPFLMFVGEQHGKAEEAINFYISKFRNSRVIAIDHYEAGEDSPEGTVRHARFSLNGQEFMSIDSSADHHFTFTPAISFFVKCETQKEVDKFWEELSAGGKKDRCGWLTDKYGVSWQIVPTEMEKLLDDTDPERSKRVMDAMLQMDKLDIEKLKQAYDNKVLVNKS